MKNNTQEPSNTSIGARLKNAREEMNMTQKEAAARLHLSVNFIDIMEKEDFANGPPATFMRGYLRSYARLLHLSQKEVNAAIEQLGMNTPAAAIISPILNTSFAADIDRYTRWSTYLIILILAILVGIWWNSRPTETNTVKEPNKTAPAIKKPSRATPAPSPVPNINTPHSPVPSAAPQTSLPPALIANPVRPETPPSPGIVNPVDNTPMLIMAQPTQQRSVEEPSPTTKQKPARSRKRYKRHHTQMSVPEPGLF